MKRLLDIIVSLSALILLSPLLILIALLVFFKLGSPILFKQTRPGFKKVPFMMYKFRTMTQAQSKDGTLLSDAERLTQFGQFLRSSSLDELPELINVLKGEMSLVGPRPLLMDYLPLYTPEQTRRHNVRPGITGWAQINGRNAITWKERFSLDTWYVDHYSFWLDICILFSTIFRVVKREGISQDGEATMSRFTGES